MFKAFADNKLNVAQMMGFISQRVASIVGKEEKFDLPAFSTKFSIGFFVEGH